MHCRESRYVNSLIIQLGSPCYLVQIIHQSEKDLRKAVGEIKSLLDNELDLEIIPVGEDEMLINTLPFMT